MRALEIYRTGVDALVDQFIQIYFHDVETDVDFIWARNHGIWIVNINDYYLNINDIEAALMHEIPVDTFFDWYDQWTESEWKLNLYTYAQNS